MSESVHIRRRVTEGSECLSVNPPHAYGEKLQTLQTLPRASATVARPQSATPSHGRADERLAQARRDGIDDSWHEDP
jgi:hypothetical protein